MKRWRLSISLAGPNPRENMRRVVQWPQFTAQGLPDWVEVDNSDRPVNNWQKELGNAAGNAAAMWRSGEWQIVFTPRSELLSIGLQHEFTKAVEGVAVVETMDFTVSSFGTVFKESWSEANYPTWGFGRSMIDHGWGCAFRGAGHDRLVSRRWLDFGPWRVIRRPNDTTFIQFHDLDLTDPAAAYAQAAPGHQRMGNDAIGGYLQHQLDWIIGDVKGLYLAEACSLEIVVGPHNTVDQEDMLSMCALRYKHRLTPPSTGLVRDIAYIFINRADAETHLHELWLRELQCWYVDGAGKHRLDHTYHPTPNPPDWVKRLNLRDATK